MTLFQGVKGGRFFDRVGAAGSTLCMIHCFLSAFLPSALALFGIDAMLNHQFEWGFTIFAILFAAMALWSGYRKHRSKLILCVFLMGISGLILSRVIEQSSGHHHEASPKTHHAGEHMTAKAPHHDHHEEGGLDLHLIGTLIGIGAGASIVFGHLQSIKVTRRFSTSS